MLDERVKSPILLTNGVQRDEGAIHIVYDYKRTSDGAVLMATFTEDDARAGCEVTDNVQLQVEAARLPQEQE